MENKGWFVHFEWVVVLVTLIGGFYMIDSKIDAVRQDTSMRVASQCERTDKLYEMWVTTQKEIYDLRVDNNQKFYDLLNRENKG